MKTMEIFINLITHTHTYLCIYIYTSEIILTVISWKTTINQILLFIHFEKSKKKYYFLLFIPYFGRSRFLNEKRVKIYQKKTKQQQQMTKQ